MDAQNPSSTVTFANRTPLRIGAVGLKARDLSRLTDFYTQAIGLDVHRPRCKTARLGAGGVTLLELEAAPDALPDDPRTAGLYHTAFLQPTRADLARWLVHVARNRVQLSGASDHLVSEAIYLDDPEGNGIEVYRDRLPEEWRWNGDRIQMATDRLDLDNLALDAGNTTYAGAPDGLRVGHIHLRVGDLAPTQQFYCDVVGLNPTAGRGGALFMSSGRYHHHVGSNVWHSAGAGKRDDNRAGLSWFAIEAADAAARDAAIARLKAANVPLTRERGWGHRTRSVRNSGALHAIVAGGKSARQLGHRGGGAEHREHHQRQHAADHHRDRIGARRNQGQRLHALRRMDRHPGKRVARALDFGDVAHQLIVGKFWADRRDNRRPRRFLHSRGRDRNACRINRGGFGLGQ